MTEKTGTRRADAERNRERILDAAVQCLATDPYTSMGDIAAAAGVGRVTVYGHFASRYELLEAVFVRSMRRADQSLDQVDVEGDPWTSLQGLVEASWQIVAASSLLIRPATEELGAEVVHKHHARSFARIQRLIRRGRASGVFRSDLPEAWMITCFFSIMHAAANELAAGRITQKTAQRIIWPTIASLFRVPSS